MEEEHDDAYWKDMAAEIEADIKVEEGYWQSQRINLNMIAVNAYLLQIKINAILEVIYSLGMSEAELNVIFQRHVLKQLQSDRAMILQERDRANTEIAIAKKNLLGPDGTPLNL